MTRARRLGPITLTTPDIAGQVGYYSDIVGLSPLEVGKDRAVLVTPLGEEAIVLERASEVGLRAISFQLAPKTSLARVAGTLVEMGVKAERVGGITPGIAEAVQFVDPIGTTVQLFAECTLAGGVEPGRGLSPFKLGHVARRSDDPKAVSDFYLKTMGFRVSDWKEDYAVFMRSGSDHHTVNIFKAAGPPLHHIAFEMKDAAELVRAADFVTGKGLKLDWGPARHVIGHNMACYHSNSDGVRVEFYAEMDIMADEELGYFAPRPWHEQRPLYPRRWPMSTPRNYWLPDLP